jgi:hypothetical protein
MTDQANAILRGGPADGTPIFANLVDTNLWTSTDGMHYYLPTGLLGEQFLELVKYIHCQMMIYAFQVLDSHSATWYGSPDAAAGDARSANTMPGSDSPYASHALNVCYGLFPDDEVEEISQLFAQVNLGETEPGPRNIRLSAKVHQLLFPRTV